jgi:hypothetical protein
VYGDAVIPSHAPERVGNLVDNATWRLWCAAIRQPKGTATDWPSCTPPRQSSTLPGEGPRKETTGAYSTRRQRWPADQRVSNLWQLALVGLRDAGFRPVLGEQPEEWRTG